MSDMARNVSEREEFWRPPVEAGRERVPHTAADSGACPNCHTEFVMGSRFCHVCGAERQIPSARRGAGIARLIDLTAVKNALGLSTGAVTAFFIGVVCVLAALGTGLAYSANTLVDWQAVQVWRIEWLLAAVAAFLAGLLLKRSDR